VVVVDAGSGAAAAAGLKRGDELLAWTAPFLDGTRRAVESPLDVEEAEAEGSRGPVTFSGRRDGRPATWTVGPGSWSWYLSRNHWGLETRPPMGAAALALLESGRALSSARTAVAAAGPFCQGADAAARDGDAALAAFFRIRAARALAGLQPQEADALYAEASRGVPARHAATLLLERGARFWYAGDAGRAAEIYEAARAAAERADPDGLGVARAYVGLGVVARIRNRMDEWERYAGLALAIRERLTPGSLAVAEATLYRSMAEVHGGRVEAAEADNARALALIDRLDRESHLALYALSYRGLVEEARGDFAAAERTYRDALARAPRAVPLGGTLSATTETIEWAALNNLGGITLERGDVAEAEALHRRALANAEGRVKVSLPNLQVSLLNLAQAVRRRGRLDEAERLVARALDLGPHAAAVREMAEQRAARGDVAEARRLHEAVLADWIRITPDSELEAASRLDLATLALARGDLDGAEDEGSRALAIRERKSPGGLHEAETLHLLARVSRRRGDAAGAAERLCRAVEALEGQRAKLGGTEARRAAFAETFADVYHDYVDVLLELGRRDDAFEALERSRARGFLAMLAERDLAFGADVPADLAAESARIAREYDRTLARLGREADPGRTLATRLVELRAEGDRVVARMRERSPRLASLRYPVPLGVAGARAALDPGTVLLSYSVGPERAHLFVLAPGTGPLPVLTIERPRAELSRRVKGFRRLLEEGRRTAGTAALLEQGRALYRDLLAPAAPYLRDAERIVVCPDGPLHALPFAALARDPEPGYLVEWKPIHVALSATVYAELSRTAAAPQSRRLEVVAFGDPRMPRLAGRDPGSLADDELRSAVAAGFGFEPLPSSRAEARGIAALYGRRGRPYLGAEATEERARSVGTGVRYVHFACHGLLDEASPMSSALVLSIPDDAVPGRDNGLLQAWEVLERVRLDADLVTLSACETALGREMGGEGLVGLTRAFQYAGARSVLGSLWKVADRSTGTLMRRLYVHLKAGKPKDEALRAAQRDLLASGDARLAHPFAWAGFQLAGSWR